MKATRQLSLFEAPQRRGLAARAAEFKPGLEVRYSPRLLHGWRAEWQGGPLPPRLVVPAILEWAPGHVVESLLQWTAWAVGAKGRTRALNAQKARWEAEVMAYLDNPHAWEHSPEHGLALRRLERRRGRRLATLRPRGSAHDLEAVFQDINRRFFSGELRAKITWSARIGGLSTHRVERDPSGSRYDLITISRGYDFPDVSRDVLGGVVYHEALHVAIPPHVQGGRRVVHGREFRRRERLYPHYAEWVRWHRNRLPFNLKRLRRASLPAK